MRKTSEIRKKIGELLLGQGKFNESQPLGAQVLAAWQGTAPAKVQVGLEPELAAYVKPEEKSLPVDQQRQIAVARRDLVLKGGMVEQPYGTEIIT